MPAPTLDRVLSEAESLSEEDRDLLEELLRRRRNERWRQDTAAAGRRAEKDFQSGKLRALSAGDAIGRLRELK